MRIKAFSALLGLSVITSCASARVGGVDPLSIPAGTQARIVVPGASTDFMKLTVVEATRDSLRYRLTLDAVPKSLAWQAVGRMDVTRGRHSNFLPGLGIGLLTGLVGGVILGSSTADGNDGRTPSAMGALGGMMGAVSGAILGGVVGLAARTQTWIPVSIPRPTTDPTSRR